MSGTWLTIKWMALGIETLYLALQCIALWRLRGELRRRCVVVLNVMFVVLIVAYGIRDVFETPDARRVELAIIGTFSFGAVVALVRLLGLRERRELREARE